MKRINVCEHLRAIVTSRQNLMYAAGADASIDRPAHVRAASNIVRWSNDRTKSDLFAIMQDDANFVALFDRSTGKVSSITLPAGFKEKRQFQEETKKYKLDIEAAFVVNDEAQDSSTLYCCGSGSSSKRENILTIQSNNKTPPQIINASKLYERFRNEPAFSGSELNIEGLLLVVLKSILIDFFLGVIYLPQLNVVRFINRGNGAAKGDLQPVNATCDIHWPDLKLFLHTTTTTTTTAPVPKIFNVVQYDLGSIDGVKLTFTDATVANDGAICFVASAEGSPDAVSDGEGKFEF